MVEADEHETKNCPEVNSTGRRRFREHLTTVDAEYSPEQATSRSVIQELEASRQSYVDLYDFAPVGYATLDRLGCVVKLNLTATALLGHKREELLGRPLVPLVDPPERRRYLKFLSNLRSAPCIFSEEFQFSAKNKNCAVLQLVGESSAGAGSRNGAIRIAFFDVTERRRAERALLESEARFRVMADFAPVMIWVAGPDKACTYVNRTWLEFRGRTLQQELGNGWTEGVHPDDWQRCLDRYNTAFATHTEFVLEYRIRRHDGEYRWILDHGVPRFAPPAFAGFIGSCVDITDRRHAEELLHQAADQLEAQVQRRTAQLMRANAKLRAEMRARQQAEAARARLADIVESASDAIVGCGLDLRISSWNKAASKLYGYTEAEIIGRPLSLLHPPDRRGEFQRIFERVRRGEVVEAFETVRLRKGGVRVDVSLSDSPIKDARHRVVGVAHIARDIRRRKQAEQALRASEARLQAIMDNSPSMIFLKDWKGRYLHFNRRFALAFHLAAAKAIGKTDAELFPPKQAAAFRTNDFKVIESGVPMQFEEVAQHADGPHTSIVTKFPLRDETGRIYGVAGIVTDVTERRRLEREVAKVAERERQRIAGDLHDGLGQQLTGISYLSNLLKQDLAARGLPEAAAAGRISQMLDEAVAQSRRLAHGLYTVPCESGGLMAALEELAAQTSEMFGVTCRFTCVAPVLVNDPATAQHLYRIAQEAVTNALKHGRASRVNIGLSATSERLVLAVSNDGMDLNKTKRRARGLGLRIMQDRVQQMGGRVVLQQNSRRETQLLCIVPNPCPASAAS